MPQGISPSLLPQRGSIGANTVIKNCTRCHGLPAPGLHTAQEWPSVLKRMTMHMEWSGKWMKIDIPDANELSVVLNYLQENAQTPIDKSAYSDLEGESGKAFSQICAQCHVLPSPKQHTAEEWQTVVGRMIEHMTVLKKRKPDEHETKNIVEYLKLYSKDS